VISLNLDTQLGWRKENEDAFPGKDHVTLKWTDLTTHESILVGASRRLEQDNSFLLVPWLRLGHELTSGIGQFRVRKKKKFVSYVASNCVSFEDAVGHRTVAYSGRSCSGLAVRMSNEIRWVRSWLRNGKGVFQDYRFGARHGKRRW
jgi:hypothetical protein